MIAVRVIDQVKTLLAQGRLSQRAIARRVGVSRGTVHAIARGKRPDHAYRSPQQGDHLIAPSGLYVRCRGCGGKVQMPCLACYVRGLMRDKG